MLPKTKKAIGSLRISQKTTRDFFLSGAALTNSNISFLGSGDVLQIAEQVVTILTKCVVFCHDKANGKNSLKKCFQKGKTIRCLFELPMKDIFKSGYLVQEV